MSIARFLAAIAALCTGLALLAWLALVTVVGGAMVGFGGAPAATGTVAPGPTSAVAAVVPSATDVVPTTEVAAATGIAPTVSTSPATPRTTASASATDATPGRGTDGVSQLAVDWPTIPTLVGWTPVTTTASFLVYAAEPDDAVLVAAAQRWAPRLESILDYVGDRLGRDLPTVPTAIVFAKRYEAACPARGLAAPPDAERTAPLIMVFIDADTLDVQIRAVLAHEITHHLTMDGAFVGDGVLTEGIANWGAGAYALAWQGFDSWDAAARTYLSSGDYVSVADPNGLVPPSGEACIARRDRVYNVRSAFVDWLIARYGIETVLAMPKTTIAVDAGNGETAERTVPDYAAATGDSLTQLERRWLAELTRDAAPPAADAR
ncbi:MAG: hypothetical protein IPG72_04105 [Ardenticatenales bacterium]|nr:hypothetical protein [Ardenticatenales bacterium]